jgi:mannose-1-phosphate guanylyltransferase
MALHVVVMAGGKGERLWPVSRAGRPKQLISFESDKSLLRATVDRLLPLVEPERVCIVTGSDIAPQVAAELPDLPASNILTEPFGRNTAPCIAYAAAWIARKDQHGIMAIFPSDHAITDTEAFQKTVAFGAQCLQDFPEHLITIGIEPDHPETGYGYIAPSDVMHSDGTLVLRRVAAFHEKPDRMRAQEYIAEGCLWNAGMFMWSVDTILRDIKRHVPDLYDNLMRLSSSDWQDGDILNFYENARAVSIDYAVMEKAAKVAVIPADFGWNDVGSWDAVGNLPAKDQYGNSVQGKAYFHESRDNVVWAGGKPIVCIGIENMVVVEGEEAILVCPRNRSQDVSVVLKKIRD